MSYNYKIEKKKLFTESGTKTLLKIRDNVAKCLKSSGAFQFEKVMCTGDSWVMMAAVDYLVELGEVREIEQGDCAGQHRVFVEGNGR